MRTVTCLALFCSLVDFGFLNGRFSLVLYEYCVVWRSLVFHIIS